MDNKRLAKIASW